MFIFTKDNTTHLLKIIIQMCQYAFKKKVNSFPKSILEKQKEIQKFTQFSNLTLWHTKCLGHLSFKMSGAFELATSLLNVIYKHMKKNQVVLLSQQLTATVVTVSCKIKKKDYLE